MPTQPQRILVTGIAGFIGSNLGASLVQLGHEVFGIDDLSIGKKERIPAGVTFLSADLATVDFGRRLPKGIDTVFHLAGQSSAERSFVSPEDDLKRNALTTLRLLEFGRKAEISRFVFASSMAVYGRQDDAKMRENTPPAPISPYGASKASAEAYLQCYSDYFPSLALRMFNVYGPGQALDDSMHGMVGIFLSQALSGGPLEVKGPLNRIRDFIYVEDVVKAYVASLGLELRGSQQINLGSGQPTSVRSLIEEIRKFVPPFKVVESSGTPGDQFQVYADTQRRRQVLGLTNTATLAAGLESTVSHLRNILPHANWR